MRSLRLNSRRAAVATIALTVHGLFLLFVLLVRTPPRQSPVLPQFVSLWLTAEPPENASPQAPAIVHAISPIIPRQETSVAPSKGESTVIAPEVDWTREGSIVARSHGESLQSGQAESFGKPVEKMRQPCIPKESSFVWNPEEKRTGFSGGLPFVRLGKRCVLGLGFFGCTLGALPEPNSHLFDDMKNENRQESSVPDPDYCD